MITSFPDDWDHFSSLPNCAGVFPVYASSADNFLNSLSSWAHTNKGGRDSVILLLDDLECMEQLDFDDRQTLRWLLFRGPSRRVWPIVTVNTGRASQVETWLDAFRTRIYGHIESCPPLLAGKDHQPIFQSLNPKTQFALLEERAWLKFWIPS